VERLTTFDAVVCRVVPAPYSPLNSKGSRRLGRRFNPRGLDALYFATTPDLALRDSTQRSTGRDFAPFAPRTIVCVRLRLAAVLDLHDEEVRTSVGLALADIASTEWQATDLPTPTQALGLRAHQAGVEAILYPSRLNTETANIVVFPDNLRAGSVMTVVEEEG
jgi:RES domain-containing protein